MPPKKVKTDKKTTKSHAKKTLPKPTPKPEDIAKERLKPMNREQLEELRRRLQKKFH